MSCDNEIADEWARCSGENASNITIWWRQVKTKNWSSHSWSLGRLWLKLPHKGSLFPWPKSWRQQHYQPKLGTLARPTIFVRSRWISCFFGDFRTLSVTTMRSQRLFARFRWLSRALGDPRVLLTLNKAWWITSSEKWVVKEYLV